MSKKIKFGPIKSVFYPDDNANALEIRTSEEIHRSDYWLIIESLDSGFHESQDAKELEKHPKIKIKSKEAILKQYETNYLTTDVIDREDAMLAMAEWGRQEAAKFGEWLKESNWGEKETWGKHDPPSIPTMEELYEVFLK